MTKVEIDGISKSYSKDKPVLKPLDLTVESGELFFLLGPSGCGKSTLLRILSGLLSPDSGTIRFNGADVSNLPPEKRLAAMVFQNYALWPHLTVYENVAFGLRAAGAKKADIDREVKSALEVVRLADFAQRKVPSLSGGQQQRVALARAIAVNPALLLLDEPLSNLDARLRDEMRLEIRRITKERNLTAIYVTHDRREALSMADRIAVLNEGVLQQIGTPEELYRRPANRFVASFLGDANFLNGKVMDIAGGQLTIDAGHTIFRLPGDGLKAGERVTVMLRPESLSFTETAEVANTLKVTIEHGVYLGDHREWVCKAGDTELMVNESNPPPRDCGKEYTLEVKPENIVLLQD